MKKNLVFLLSILFFFHIQAQQLEPQRISKTWNEAVPQGMYIYTSNAGERWLLPEGMSAPPEREVAIEYFKNKRNAPELQVIGQTDDGHQIFNRAIDANEAIIEDSQRFWDDLPKPFAKTLNLEKDLNLHAQTSPDLLSLGDFSPTSKKAFQLPYIPIPEGEMDFAYLAEYSQQKTKRIVKTTINGETHYRFFIHPNFPNKSAYQPLIEKYGIVYHYEAVTTSSPRSLIVVDPSSKEINWVKPSLPKKIDGSVRINIPTKIRRAPIISEAVANVPQERLQQVGLEFMYEPASLQPKGLGQGTIFREIPDSFLNPGANRSWLPAFALNASHAPGESVLENMIKKSGKAPSKFISDDIIRPLLSVFTKMAYQEGLPGELHTQNFYYKLNRRGLPTGEILFKDLDGFRYDVEIATRNKRNLDFLAKFDEPFYWAKFSNALGTGSEGIPFVGSWFYKLIRNVNGFETLSSYILSVSDRFPQLAQEMGVADNFVWNKDTIQKLFDDIARDEAQKITGIILQPDEYYGFAKDKGLNQILHKFRANISNNIDPDKIQKMKENKNLQKYLADEFEKLKGQKRAHLRSNTSKSTYYIFYQMDDNSIVIEARNPNPRNAYQNPTIGLALPEQFNSDIGTQFRQGLRAVANDCDFLMGASPI